MKKILLSIILGLLFAPVVWGYDIQGNLDVKGYAGADRGLRLKEMTAPDTTLNYGKVYTKSTDSLLYFLTDGGTEYQLSGAIHGSGTAGKLMKWLTTNTATDATNTDTEVANAVIASHTRGHTMANVLDHTDWPVGLTVTELAFVDSATSNIQAQIDLKANSADVATDTELANEATQLRAEMATDTELTNGLSGKEPSIDTGADTEIWYGNKTWGAPPAGVTIEEVKADTDIASTIALKHTTGTDTILQIVGPQVNQSQLDYSEAGWGVYGTRSLAQTFIPSKSGNCSAISVYCDQSGTRDGIVEIRTTLGDGTPSDTVLGTETFGFVVLENKVIFDPVVSLTLGTTYAIVLDFVSETIWYNAAGSDVYANGKLYYNYGVGGGWEDQTNDLFFKVWLEGGTVDLINSGTLKENLAVDSGITIDGRDISVDGAKLEGIEAGAVSLATVKADADISDVITRVHDAATAGSGISISGQEITNTDTGSGAVATHEVTYDHDAYDGAVVLQHAVNSDTDKGSVAVATHNIAYDHTNIPTDSQIVLWDATGADSQAYVGAIADKVDSDSTTYVSVVGKAHDANIWGTKTIDETGIDTGKIPKYTTDGGGKWIVVNETAGGGGGTTYAATHPVVVTGQVISMGQATTTDSGFLSTTNWNTFNEKVDADSATYVSTVQKASGSVQSDSATYVSVVPKALGSVQSDSATYVSVVPKALGSVQSDSSTYVTTVKNSHDAVTVVSPILLSGQQISFSDTNLVHGTGTSAQYIKGDGTKATLNQAAVSGLTTADTPTFNSITLSNGQIAFPAIQNPSSNANTLDDYEEGTWTPTYASTGASFSYTTQVGTYVKVGRFVYASIYFLASASGTVTNALTITGLPFTSFATSNSGGSATPGIYTFTTTPSLYMNPNNTIATFYAAGTVTQLTPTTTGMNAGAKYFVSVMLYKTAN